MAIKKKSKRKSGGIAVFARLVRSNKSYKAAKTAQRKADARAKKAYKKAVAAAKKKIKSRRR